MSEKEYDFLPNLYLPDQISFDEIVSTLFMIDTDLENRRYVDFNKAIEIGSLKISKVL